MSKIEPSSGLEDEVIIDKVDETETKNKKEKSNVVGFFQLFRFATKMDIFMMFIGLCGSIGNGAMFPLLMLFFTGIIDEFSSYGNCGSTATNSTLSTSDVYGSLLDNMRDQVLYLVYVGIATIFFTYIQITFWILPSENETLLIRKKLFYSILKQDIGWFDVYKSGELTNRLTDDVNKIKEGIGEKLGNFFQYIASFIAGIIIGLIQGWKLTLVIMSVSPLILLSSYLYTMLAEDMTKNELKYYAKAGAIAEEVLTAIRTVFAFNGSQKEHKRYDYKLEEAKKLGIKKGFINGALLGFLWLVIFCAYALGFWYGWKLTTEIDPVTGVTEYTVGKILLVFFVIIIGVFSLGNAAPYFSTLSSAKAAAYEVFMIIDRKPVIDSSSESGEKLDNLVGNLELDNVRFNYPSRSETQILNGASFKIKAGSTIALVGHSGCGKSTCIQLFQRFYDPLEGCVKIDDRNIKDFNVQWLRSQLGIVNQEPVLFGTTIKENIRFGKDDVTDDDIIDAAKNANAHDFIMTLPDKYETLVGDRGGQLSGGQKQRIAIARALVRKPKILLLDEATSALDNESESIVQAALDKASCGRTTIIVAHRLTTIRNADIIYTFDKGVIAESGNHDSLMSKKGIYYNLVVNQQTQPNNDQKKQKSIDETKSKEKEQEETALKNDNSTVVPDEKKDKNDEKEKEEEPSMARVFKMNQPEWMFIVLGCLAAILSGGVQPAFGVILSKAIGIFSKCDADEIKRNIELYCILFVVIAVVAFLSSILQSGMFGISGEALTKRIRSDAFKSILSQEIGWFDDKSNSVGVLATKLSVEAAAVQGATGVRLGFMFMNVANLGVGIVIAFFYSWPITLLIIAFIPLLIIGGIFQTQALAGFAESNKEILETAGSISNETIGNIRTVVILNKEKYYSEKYWALLDKPVKNTRRSAHINGFILGITTSIMFFAIGAAFSLGAYLIEKNLFNQDIEKIMIVFNCVLFGAQSVGQAAAILPDYAKAKLAMTSMFNLFDRVPKINNYSSNNGLTISDEDFDGNIKVNNVEFTYPSRQNAQILKKINLTIKKGQRVALVGSSGCGKSTITQLLERFYDPDEGDITLCNKKLSDLDLYWLRNKIGIVSQEPILFDLSIKENIAYGDNSREISMDEIIEAAKKANIHDFISKLPLAYETNCGSKGTQLSGGQKQRIAIARALIRDPKILLLDEATSALDTESEKIVQDALEKAQHGRTCIIIAHRLSTIKTCDVIFVLQNGVVTEAGTHSELMNSKGFYAKLNEQQKN